MSNAPAGASIQTMLLVAFSRWRSSLFRGPEVRSAWTSTRRVPGLKRYLILVAVRVDAVRRGGGGVRSE